VIIRIVLCLLALGIPLGATMSSATAADEVGVSVDGSTWSSSLSTPLFDSGFLWVPGDLETERFYVRNRGPSDAVLRIEVRSADPDDLLADDDMIISARAGSGDWISMANGSPSSRLTDQVIGVDGAVPVDVRVKFSWASPNESQSDRLPLLLVVTMSGDADGGDRNGDGLPETGSDISPFVLCLAAMAVGAGMALISAGRRRVGEVTFRG